MVTVAPPTLQGRRVPDAMLTHMVPGDYTRHWFQSTKRSIWLVCCPDGDIIMLHTNEDNAKGMRHHVSIHGPNAITVDGVIASDNGWRGMLIRGVWETI